MGWMNRCCAVDAGDHLIDLMTSSTSQPIHEEVEAHDCQVDEMFGLLSLSLFVYAHFLRLRNCTDVYQIIFFAIVFLFLFSVSYLLLILLLNPAMMSV